MNQSQIVDVAMIQMGMKKWPTLYGSLRKELESTKV
jgi:hypothetical protein